MKFKVDENLPVEAADLLQQAVTTQSRSWSSISVVRPTPILLQYVNAKNEPW